MIRKSISIVLFFILLIYYAGCSSYRRILLETDAEQEIILQPDAEALRKCERVKITTIKNKIYELSKVKVEGLKFIGTEWMGVHKSRQIEISSEEIKKIELEQFNLGLTLLGVFIAVGVPLIVLGIGFGKV